MNNEKHSLSDFLELSSEILSKQISAIRLFTQHDPSFGQACENLVRVFFDDHIPAPFKVGTGFIHDPITGKSSKQCDIIIYNASKGPIYFRNGELVIVSPESVEFVIELKGNISASGQIEDSLKNLESVKQFTSKIRWSLLAFSSEMNAKAVTKKLLQHPKKLSFENYPDHLISLDGEQWIFKLWGDFKGLRRFVPPRKSKVGFNFLFSSLLAWISGKAKTELYIDFDKLKIVGLHHAIKIGETLTEKEEVLLECGWELEKGNFKKCLTLLENNRLKDDPKGHELEIRCYRYLGDSENGLARIKNPPAGAVIDKKMHFELLFLARKFEEAESLFKSLSSGEIKKEKEYWILNELDLDVYQGRYDEGSKKLTKFEQDLPQHAFPDILKIWIQAKQKGIESVDKAVIKEARDKAFNESDRLFRNSIIDAISNKRADCLKRLIKLQTISPVPVSIYSTNSILSEILTNEDLEILESLQDGE